MRFSRCLVMAGVYLSAGGGLSGCAPPPIPGSLPFGGQTQAPRVAADAAAGSPGFDAGSAGGSGGFAGADAFDQRMDLPGAPPDVPRDIGASPDLRGYESGLAGCHLDIDVTTDTTDEDYAPSHVAAIWIANSTGRFIKSVAVWANRRISKLPKWIAATTAAGVRQNRVDAVTGATLFFHGRRTLAWKCTGVDNQRVPDGSYRVCFELNETNGASESECVPFTMSPMAETTRPPDVRTFKYRTLNFFP